MEIAAGFTIHTGWAVSVLLAGDLRRPLVLDRRRVTLVPDDLPGAVYHAAQGLPLARAERLVATVHDAVERTTRAAFAELADAAAADGELVAVGITGAPREVPGLAKVLASHTLLHLAEGELYRGAICDAAHERGLLVLPLHPKHWADDAAVALEVTSERVATRLADLKAELGAPWRVDHKVAAAAALTALSAASWERSASR